MLREEIQLFSLNYWNIRDHGRDIRMHFVIALAIMFPLHLIKLSRCNLGTKCKIVQVLHAIKYVCL